MSMNQENNPQIRPWYKEPWPWVAIAIPGAAVIMGAITLYLALANPDYLVVEDEEYRQISSGLRAQDADEQGSQAAAQKDGDGEP